MVSSASSHSHRISFVAILVLFIRIFTFLSDLILQRFSLSSIFIYLIWCIFLNFFYNISFISDSSSYFFCSILSVYFSCCVIFCPFAILFIICSFSSLSNFSIISSGAAFPSGVIFLPASSICAISLSVNLLSLSVSVFLHLLVCSHLHIVYYSNSFCSRLYMFVWYYFHPRNNIFHRSRLPWFLCILPEPILFFYFC